MTPLVGIGACVSVSLADYRLSEFSFLRLNYSTPGFPFPEHIAISSRTHGLTIGICSIRRLPLRSPSIRAEKCRYKPFKSHPLLLTILSLRVATYGGLAGEALWLSSYPFDVIKSKMQSDGFGPNRKYGSMRDCFAQTWRLEGARGFWKGIGPTLLRAMPVSAGTFAV